MFIMLIRLQVKEIIQIAKTIRNIYHLIQQEAPRQGPWVGWEQLNDITRDPGAFCLLPLCPQHVALVPLCGHKMAAAGLGSKRK